MHSTYMYLMIDISVTTAKKKNHFFILLNFFFLQSAKIIDALKRNENYGLGKYFTRRVFLFNAGKILPLSSKCIEVSYRTEK